MKTHLYSQTTCNRGIKKQKVSCGKTKQNSIWEGKQLSNLLSTEIVKCVTEVLYPARSMRSFRNRGEGEGIITLTQFDFRLQNLSRCPQPIVSLIFSSIKGNLRMNTDILRWEPLPFFLSQAGNTGEKFNDLSQATSWFSSRLGERNERNALMCGNKQLHCVFPSGLIWEGMNLEITKSTARSTTTTHTCIM